MHKWMEQLESKNFDFVKIAWHSEGKLKCGLFYSRDLQENKFNM